MRAARAARALVATARMLPVLREAGVELDALVGSGSDPSEEYVDGMLDPPPRLVVRTAGARGGEWVGGEGRTGKWAGGAELPARARTRTGAATRSPAGSRTDSADGRGIDGALDLGRALRRVLLHGSRTVRATAARSAIGGIDDSVRELRIRLQIEDGVCTDKSAIETRKEWR